MPPHPDAAPAQITVAGVDLAAGRGVSEVAALSFTGASRPLYRADDQRRVTSDGEIVAAVVASGARVIALDAPLSLPASVMAALTSAPPAPRLLDASPYTRAAERDPFWRELGLRPLPVSFLGGLTFRALTLAPRLRAALPDATLIEVFPTATLRVLERALQQDAGPVAGAADSPREGAGRAKRARGAKTTPERRAATQRLLARVIEGLPTPEGPPLGADLLDALAAALTAVAYARGAFRALGDADEGQIIVPYATITDDDWR